jgi:hypothetical protein
MKTVIVALTLMLLTSRAEAQKAFKRQDLVGAWQYVYAVTEFIDGRKEAQFTDNPQGIFIILPSGHYSHIIMSDNLPNVSSRRFKEMTLEEAEKIAEGVLAHYGTWYANEGEGTFVVAIRKSSFPNFDGAVQVRTITELTRDTLAYVNDLAVTAAGARAIARLRRIQ